MIHRKSFMDIRKMISFLKKSFIMSLMGITCGMIGAVEGAISGGTGAIILKQNTLSAAVAGSLGVASLGFIEGLLLGGLAINGFFGTAKDMERTGYKNIDKRIFGYLGYTINQFLGGVIVGLLMRITHSVMPIGDIVIDVAVGASITGVVITPIVTTLAVFILDYAYSSTRATS